MTSRPVIVGVDGSEDAMLAAEWAALQARRHGAPLEIVSAPPPTPWVGAYQAAPELVGNASLLVVGSRGAGGFPAMVLGSVSGYVATRARCPVVVVRQETMAVHGEIVVGIRDPQETTAALAFAFTEAARRGASLVAVHTWYWPPAALSPTALSPAPAGETAPGPANPDSISARAASSLAAALAPWREKYPSVRARPDVVHGHAGHVLASYSARADLVVLGRHAHQVNGGSGLGSIQHAVLDHARGPVAVVPSDG